jgi:xanthine/uracil permease
VQGSVDLIYGLDDIPPWRRCLIYGIQWALIMIPSLTIFSTISSQYLGLTGAEQVLFFQRLSVVVGVVMIIQTIWGHRYPLLDGPASALLLSFIILAPHGISTIQGGMMVGACSLVLLSVFGLLRYLEPLFTDNVIGVILILVALTLIPYLAPMVIGEGESSPHGDPLVFGISVLVMVSIALFSNWLTGFPKTISLFLGIILGTVLMWALGRMDMGGVREASWFSLPRPFVPGIPRFSVSAIITFLVAYVAVLINAVGSIYSIGEVVGKEGLTGRLRRGIAVTGIGGIGGGSLGVVGTVSFAFSPGVVLVTRVGSRFAVTVCGGLIFSLAFFSKFLAVLTSFPASVVGAATLTAMAAQIGAGISIITRSGRSLDGRDYMVIGIPVLMGGVVSILPHTFFAVFPATAHALLKNGLVVGIVLVLLLEHLLLPRRL